MGPFLHTRCSIILGHQASKTLHDITLPKLCPAASVQCEGAASPSICFPRLQTSPLRLHFASTCHKKAVSVSLKNCVSEKLLGVRVEASSEFMFVFAFWYLPLVLHEVTWNPVFKIRLNYKNVVPSHEIATFGTQTILSNFWPEIVSSHLVFEPCCPDEIT
jgi:hypothetical protein